jgi:hypothetical protein
MSTSKPKADKASPVAKATARKPVAAKKSATKAATAALAAPALNQANESVAAPVAASSPTPALPVLPERTAVTSPAVSKVRAPGRKSAVLAAPKEAIEPEASAPVQTVQTMQVAPVAIEREASAPAQTLQNAPAVSVSETPARAQTGQGAPVAQAPAAPVDAKLETKLASNPPRALNSPIRIFQIYFEGWQRELLDPAFYPLDNSRNASELMEFNVFEQLQRNAATQGAALWGALSWRFTEKTGMQGADLVKQIVEHPGHDVYFCNPHPFNEGLYHNMWVQGEVSHPNFLELSRLFHEAAGLDEKDLKAIDSSSNFSAANYFVATPKFWSLFIPFVKRVLVTADKQLDPQVRDVIHSKVADDKGLHAGATYVPFIVERLFMAFMRGEGKELTSYKIALPERERELNVHLKLLREMKDVAHKTQSAWLAACWVNYRNLYLSQTNGKAWCEKYLRAITPTEVRFG